MTNLLIKKQMHVTCVRTRTHATVRTRTSTPICLCVGNTHTLETCSISHMRADSEPQRLFLFSPRVPATSVEAGAENCVHGLVHGLVRSLPHEYSRDGWRRRMWHFSEELFFLTLLRESRKSGALPPKTRAFRRRKATTLYHCQREVKTVPKRKDAARKTSSTLKRRPAYCSGNPIH